MGGKRILCWRFPCPNLLHQYHPSFLQVYQVAFFCSFFICQRFHRQQQNLKTCKKLSFVKKALFLSTAFRSSRNLLFFLWQLSLMQRTSLPSCFRRLAGRQWREGSPCETSNWIGSRRNNKRLCSSRRRIQRLWFFNRIIFNCWSLPLLVFLALSTCLPQICDTCVQINFIILAGWTNWI